MMGTTVYAVLLLLGALQGFVLGAVLWFTSSRRKTSNRFLAALLFFLAYRLLVEVLWDYGIINLDSWLYYVALEFNWVYGALLFFYVRSYLDPSFRLSRHVSVHFIPVLIETAFSLFIKLQNLYWDGTRESLSWAGYWGYYLWQQTPFQFIVSAGLVLFYAWKSQQAINQYLDTFGGTRSRQYVVWLRTVLYVLVGFSILVLVCTLTDFLFFNFAFGPFYIFPIYLGMALITYWLALQGFGRRNDPYPSQTTQLPPEQNAEAEALQASLARSMDDDLLYLDPELSLAGLAETLNVKPYVLTALLNGRMGTTFTEYINGFRVQEAIARIQDPTNDHLTLTAIGLDSGFNSKASFNRIFKQITGDSPGSYRKSRGSTS